MTVQLVVIGGGGMGRCVLDLVDAVNAARAPGQPADFDVLGVVDDGAIDEELLSRRGVRFLGGVSQIDNLPLEIGYVIGIANCAVKARLDARLRSSGRLSPVIVHPNVHLGADVEIDPGSLVCSHVSIENHVRLGRHVHVNQNSTVGHDSALGDYSTVSPLVAVSGAVTMGEGTFVGTTSGIRQGVSLGEYATVGMGSTVLNDVAAHTTVIGVPARNMSPRDPVAD